MRNVGLHAAALIFGLVLSLAAGEVFLRVSGVWIGRHSDTMFDVIEHDAQLGWKMPPNVSRRVDFVDVEGIAVRSNSDGFWDAEFADEKPSGSCRVAFLGDSFTWGMGVDEEERFTNVIAETAGTIEALNFGMPGFGSDQAVLTFEVEARRYEPDLAVLTVYENDYYDNVHDLRYGRAKPYFEIDGRDLALKNVPVTEATFWDHGVYNRIASPYAELYDAPVQTRPRLLHWLAKHSDLVRLLYRVSQVDVVDARAARRGPPARKVAATVPSPREENQRALQRRLLGSLRDRTAQAGARLLVVFAGKTHASVTSDMAALRDSGIPVVDATTDAIRPHLPAGAAIYFPYNQHWTAPAHRVAAELITHAVRREQLCGASDR